MTEALASAVLPGIAASAGLALGRIAVQRAGPGAAPAGHARRGARKPARGDGRGRRRSWRRSPEARGRAAADMLEFQLALLDDEDLIGPIFERIAAGEPADRRLAPGAGCRDRGISASGDEALEARVSDLADLRDRVLDALSPQPRRAVQRRRAGDLCR